MGLPIKMNLDGNKLLQEDNLSAFNLNSNYSSETNSLHNEYGFLEIEQANNLKVIGFKKIFNNQIIICSEAIGNEFYKSEIGIIRDNNYFPILRDNVTEGALFGFTSESLVQIEASLNINNEIIIYFVDGINSDKFLNITNLQVKTDNRLRIESLIELRNMIGFRLNTDVNIYLDNTSTGGNLYSGVYYVIATLWNKGGLKSHSLIVSNPIPITADNIDYKGVAVNTLTSRAINATLKVAEIPANFDYYTIYCISKINQTLKAYEVTTANIPQADFQVSITDLTASTEVSVESILLNSSDYISALTLAQVDDVLFKGNLKSIEEFDFQPYINNIEINYVSKELDLVTDSYEESTSAFYDKSFMYDEVYALYASYIIEENGIQYETKAYHIPGRPAKTTTLVKLTSGFAEENDKIDILDNNIPIYKVGDTISGFPLNEIYDIDANAKIFQGLDTHLGESDPLNMGYWENENEVYSNESKWNVLNADGTTTGVFLQGEKVRHHRFPPAYSTVSGAPNLIQSASTVKILGFTPSNVVVPDEWVDKVKKIKFYYAKRTLNNRLILGQSLSVPQHQRHRFTYPSGIDERFFNATGSFYIQDIFMNNPFPSSFEGEGFTPSNIDRTPFTGASIYNVGVTETIAGASTGNYCFATRSGTDWVNTKAAISMRPFELMLNNTEVKGNYIKNSYRIKSKYRAGAYAFGNSEPTTQLPWIYSYRLNSFVDYFGVDRAESADVNNYYKNNIRKIDSIKLYENSYIESQGDFWTRSSETRFNIEFNNRLYRGISALNALSSGQDFAIICLQDPATVNTPVGLYGSDADAYASPYITNICAYKENLYLGFDNQILCSTGFTYDIDTVETEEIYGGDTFTSFYGERSTVDFAPLFRHPAGASFDANTTQLRTTHYYICQSTSNIQLRYEGTNSWELFFPKNSLDALSSEYSNYYGYNPDYSSVNDILQPTQGLNQLDNDVTNFPNRVIKSEVNNPEILENNYLIFNPGNLTDVGLQYGQIENIFNINNKLAIHLTNDLMITMNKQTMDTSSGKAYIGAGDIFSVKPQDINSNFYGGTIGRYSGTMTPYGYFFIDPLSYTVLNFNGQTFEDVSSEGMERYFFNYSAFALPTILNNYNDQFIPQWSASTFLTGQLVKYNGVYWKALVDTSSIPEEDEFWTQFQLPTYNTRSTVDYLGYTVTYDTIYDRVIFSKKDYLILDSTIFIYSGLYQPGISVLDTYITYDNKLGFYSNVEQSNSIPLNGNWFTPVDYEQLVDDGFLIDNGFTLAYYPKIKSWVSFYSYRPNLLIGGSQFTFSSKNNTIFQHNQHNSPYYYNNTPINTIMSPIYKMDGSKRLMSLSVKTEKNYFIKYKDVGLNDYSPTVYQSETFDKYLIFNKNQMSLEKDFINTQTSRDVEGYFNFNDFRDYTNGINPTLFLNSSYNIEPNVLILESNKHWSKLRKFVDFWQGCRLSKEQSEFQSLGTRTVTVTSGISIVGIPVQLVNTNTINSVYTMDTGSGILYFTIDSFKTTGGSGFKIRYLFNSTPLADGIYNYPIEVYNSYNLALLDTQANKKQSFK